MQGTEKQGSPGGQRSEGLGCRGAAVWTPGGCGARDTWVTGRGWSRDILCACRETWKGKLFLSVPLGNPEGTMASVCADDGHSGYSLTHALSRKDTHRAARQASRQMTKRSPPLAGCGIAHQAICRESLESESAACRPFRRRFSPSLHCSQEEGRASLARLTIPLGSWNIVDSLGPIGGLMLQAPGADSALPHYLENTVNPRQPGGCCCTRPPMVWPAQRFPIHNHQPLSIM